MFNYTYTMSELDCIKSNNNYRAPCNVFFDSDRGKHRKIPAIANWNKITPEEACDLESGKFSNHKHFIFLTGDKTKQFVVDIDKKDPNRKDHEGKVGGIELFEDECAPISLPDTLTTRTISGGYHKVYQMCDELKDSIRSGKLIPHALIDILYEGCGYVFGEGYSMVHKMPPQKPPKYVIKFITNNIMNIKNSTVTNSTLNNTSTLNIKVQKDSPRTYDINNVLGSNVAEWKVAQIGDALYKLTPASGYCCVDPDHFHSDESHSCLIVRRQSVIAQCFSHGKKTIEGDVSRSVRELFFKFKSNRGQTRDAVELVLEAAESDGLVRNNGQVFMGHTPVTSYKKFVQKVLKDSEPLKDRPRMFHDIMDFMENADDSRFPLVERDKRYIGFSNGLLDIVDGELVDGVYGVLPRHYIDQPFVFDDFDTPLFDRIVRHQLEDDEIYTYMLAFIGRLLYDVRQFDELDVVPFIVGDTNTGKSTLAHIIRAMFDPCNVGTLDSKHEVIFGLSSLYRKELIMATEISTKMAEQLSSDTFKNMVCGDIISVSRKHTDPIPVQWTVPMFMCGNQHLSYHDEKGSVSRRLAIFKFEKHVEEIDGSLKDRVIKCELAKIVGKSLLAYRMLIGYATAGFWNACPDYFKDNLDEMTQDTDYIYRFLSLGPDDNAWGGRCLYFVKQAGGVMLMEDFKNKFFNWLRFKHQNVKYKWTNDHSAFRRKGFDVVRTKICKFCGREARAHCCSFYDHENRTTRITIKNIRCVDGDDN